MQTPAHWVSQQTPSAQKPVMQSDGAVQAAPGSPAFEHLPALHVNPAFVTQSDAVTHDVLQPAPAQMYGMHDDVAVLATHAPVASQLDGLDWVVASTHDAGPHGAPALVWQAPFPSQTPPVLHTDAPLT